MEQFTQIPFDTNGRWYEFMFSGSVTSFTSWKLRTISNSSIRLTRSNTKDSCKNKRDENISIRRLPLLTSKQLLPMFHNSCSCFSSTNLNYNHTMNYGMERVVLSRLSNSGSPYLTKVDGQYTLYFYNHSTYFNRLQFYNCLSLKKEVYVLNN
jgi:hypothetical protein